MSLKARASIKSGSIFSGTVQSVYVRHPNKFLTNGENFECFMQLGFNLNNGVTDTLESSSILIYLKSQMGLNTQRIWRDATLIKE